jgi:lipopolysaccharide assembly protein A
MSDHYGIEGGEAPAPRDRKRDTRMVLTGVVAVLLIWFAVINLQDVSIHFWLTTTKAPLIVVVVISVVLGAAITLLLTHLSRRRNQPEE